MDLHPTEEQAALSEMAFNALSDAFPIATARRSSSHDSALRNIASLGLVGVLAGEECGGTGLTAVEACLVAYEVGRTLTPVSLLWSMVAADVASLAGRSDLGKQLVLGDEWANLQVENATRSMAAGIPNAGVILSVRPDGASLRRRDGGTTKGTLPCIDHTTTLETLQGGLNDITSLEGGRTWLMLSLLVSSAQSGGAQRMLDIAVEHAQSRVQFGKPIGSFQAVRHTCSEMARRVEASRSLVHYAAVRLAGDEQEACDSIAAAHVMSADAAALNGSQALQILGAMGMTVEHDLNLFIKRSLMLENVIGHQRTDLFGLARLAPA